MFLEVRYVHTLSQLKLCQFGLRLFDTVNNFFSHISMFSWVEPVLSYEDEVSVSRTKHGTPGRFRTCDHVIKSLTLYQVSYLCSPKIKAFLKLAINKGIFLQSNTLIHCYESRSNHATMRLYMYLVHCSYHYIIKTYLTVKHTARI